jgi:O-antigen/teichoic acid export membrane protein
MVQVDVFWSYAFGAGFAMAAARQLIEDREKNDGNFFENKYFTHTLLFLAIIFVPSGGSLLWGFPDWETMQVAYDHHSIPAWLVSAFYVTNITQGLLGFS